MKRIRNVRNTTKFKRSIRAISPVIATLLMIAIAVVASLVVYAWVTGYIGGSTTKAGKAIQIPSFALDDAGKLHVYVQNVGQGTTQLSAVYVNDALVSSPNDQILEGNTVELVINGPYSENTKLNIKVTTTDGTFMTTTGKSQTTSTNPSGGNQAPVLAPIGDKNVNELSTLAFTASATDADAGQTLTYSLDTGFPAGATINANSGAFSWTPTEAQGPGSFPITVRVTDNGSPALNDFETITVTVAEIHSGNQAPVLAPIGDKNVNELSTLAFTASATDADAGQTLTYSLDTGFPAGATINANSGAFSWTPTEAQGPGSFPITVRVTDNGSPALNDFETITVTVAEIHSGNQAPVLAPIGDKNVNELSTLAFTASATDADAGQTLTYSLDTGFPAGATINANSGAFSWTPTEAQGPGSFPITVRVTDNGSPALNDFETITVTVNEIHPQTIFTDAFPQGSLDSSKWTSTGSVSINNNSPHQTGDYYASLGSSSSGASITSVSISATNYKTITVSYYRNTDSGVTLTVQWRIGTGTWATLETVPGGTGWPANAVSFSLGSTADGKTIQLMFTDNSQRARIDDVIVQGVPLS